MITTWERLSHKHIPELYRVACVSEPYIPKVNILEFESAMSMRDGFVFKIGDEIIGATTLSDYMPGVDAVMHVFINPAVHGKWINRELLRVTFNLPFNVLKLPRVSSYHIPGLTDAAAKFQSNLGFTIEGRKRKALLHDGHLMDVVLVGMLREECVWA
jgi:RimJ/RimL family protein N-acetyltransferase